MQGETKFHRRKRSESEWMRRCPKKLNTGQSWKKMSRSCKRLEAEVALYLSRAMALRMQPELQWNGLVQSLPITKYD